MTSITSWVRLEPQGRDADLKPGVEARLHDPLWLLTRQWQLGELDGEDGGSAMIARARFEVGRVHAIAARGGAATAYDPRTLPLDAAIEAAGRVAPRPIVDVRGRIDAGRHLLRRLAANGLGTHGPAFVTAFPLPPDPPLLTESERRFVDAVRGRAPDGAGVAAALRVSLPALPPALAIVDTDGTVAAACAAWLRWYDAHEVEPPAGPTWQPARLEYGATLHATLGGRALALDTVEHHGGALSWARFGARDLGTTTAEPERRVTTAVPTTVQYRGMPTRRYWEIEDGAANWSAVDAGPGDVGRMLLVDFALVFSDDWLIMPIELEAGTLAQIASLVVTDTFGVRTVVPAGVSDGWRMFAVDRAGPSTLFAVPPAPVSIGVPLDEVLIAADEQANLAWAIERRYAGVDGESRAIDPASSRAATPTSEPRYRLGTDVAEGWHPLVPLVRADGLHLDRAAVPGAARPPRTPIVDGLVTLAPDELAGGVARVCSRYRLARRPDGRLVVWRACDRETLPRVAVPSSGLAFDTVER